MCAYSKKIGMGYLIINLSLVPLLSASNIEEAEKHYLKGKEFLRRGDYFNADKEFKKAQRLLEKPSLQRKSYPKKRKNFKKGKLIVEKAQQLAQEGRCQEAIKFYLKALEYFPDNLSINYNLAVQYLKSGQWKKAEERLKYVVKLNPQDKDAYYNLGILYEKFLGDKEKAVKCYEKFIEFSSPQEAVAVRRWLREIKEFVWEVKPQIQGGRQ